MGLKKLEKKISNFKVSSRLYILLAILFIPLIMIGVMGLFGMADGSARLNTVYHDRLVVVGQLARINDLINEQMFELQLATKHDPRLPESSYHEETHTVQRHIDNILEQNAEKDEIWQAFLESYITEEEQEIADRFIESYNRFFDIGMTESLDMIRAGNYEQVNIYGVTDLPDFTIPVEESIDDLIEYQLRHAEGEMDGAETFFLIVLGITVTMLIATVIVSGFLSYVIIRSIKNPLDNLTNRMKDIAEGEGDLTQRIDHDSQDELGELASWVNKFLDQIHDIIKNVVENTNELRTASDSLTESSQSMSAGVEEMSQQSEMIASSATEMNQNLQVVSSAVEEMSISVSEVAKKAQDAAASTGRTSQRTHDTNEVVRTLGAEATEIGKVIESIRSIAEQTNLLALNAAIEAAGAGEAGKGFAVVAAEVKELAREAGTSSEDIKNRILSIQKSVDSTVKAIEEITGGVREINEFSSSIASAVEEQSITSKEIAQNVEQTTTASNDVAKNVNGISTALQDGAQNATGTSDLAKKLQTLAQGLGDLVDRFKV